jgi:hypothetical protein
MCETGERGSPHFDIALIMDRLKEDLPSAAARCVKRVRGGASEVCLHCCLVLLGTASITAYGSY